jgi:predicted nucleic acid-binding Zn ribbon protein
MKEFEVLRGEIKDKSNRLSTKDELNRLTRQMNSLLTTVNNHKVRALFCSNLFAPALAAGLNTVPHSLQSHQDIEKGEQGIQAEEEERRRKRKRRMLIGGAILLGLLLLVVVIICIVVPVAVVAGDSSSSSTTGTGNGNGSANGKGSGNKALARALFSDEGGTGWSPEQHGRGERGSRSAATQTTPTLADDGLQHRKEALADAPWTAG